MELLCLAYFGIGLLTTILIIDGKSFPEDTKRYEKALGVAFMVIAWPIVVCVRTPGSDDASTVRDSGKRRDPG